MEIQINGAVTRSHARRVVRRFLDEVPHSPVQEEAHERLLRARAVSLLKRRGVVLVAHYYTPAVIQDIATETGGCVSDSLEMARFCRDHEATTLVVAGVRFMGETAKILAPHKRVLIPSTEATCSLDIGCPPNEFKSFCESYPDRTVVVYANTSTAVKAQAAWVVTSSNACNIISHLDAQGEKILWAPDKFLGDYVRRTTDADMVLWDGSCVVHEEFKERALRDMKQLYSRAKILAHPESPPGVLAMADRIGSTSQIIRFAHEMDDSEFIVATDEGLFHRLRRELPHKTFLIAPTAGHGANCRSCARCPWMAMNNLSQLVACLRDGSGEILLDKELLERARMPLERMLAFQTS